MAWVEPIEFCFPLQQEISYYPKYQCDKTNLHYYRHQPDAFCGKNILFSGNRHVRFGAGVAYKFFHLAFFLNITDDSTVPVMWQIASSSDFSTIPPLT